MYSVERGVEVPGAKRYGATIVFAVLAVVLAVCGALALTVWRPAQELSASFEPEQPLVMVREGVLPLYADTVTVSAEAANPDQKVWIASGAGADVSAWLYGHSFDIVIGTKSATQLATESGALGSQSGDQGQSGDPQSGEEASVPLVAAEQGQSGDEQQSGDAQPSPIASDMWSSIKEGTGTASIVVSGDDLANVLLLSGDGKVPLASVTLTWPTPTANILAWVLLPLAALFAVAAIIAAIVTARKSRRQDQGLPVKEEALAVAEEEAVVGDDDAEASDETVVTTRPRPESDFRPGDSAEEADTAAGEPAEQSPAVGTEVGGDEERGDQAGTDDRRTVTVTTESGMMNLSAVPGGGQFPTRRALREARSKGVENLVVGSRSFATIGEQSSPDTSEESPTEIPATVVPPNIRWRSKRGAERFGQGGDSE